MDYAQLINDLIRSYSRQLSLYKDLQVLVQKINGQLALSRGDLASVMDLFDKKKNILDELQKERERSQVPATLWQEHKTDCATLPAAELLDKVLSENETAITQFLESEDQLRTYLERAMAEKGDPI